MGLPKPSNTRPSMSYDTPSSMLRPRKRALEVAILRPWELSNSCTSALSPLTSSTLPRRVSPFSDDLDQFVTDAADAFHQHQRAHAL